MHVRSKVDAAHTLPEIGRFGERYVMGKRRRNG